MLKPLNIIKSYLGIKVTRNLEKVNGKAFLTSLSMEQFTVKWFGMNYALAKIATKSSTLYFFMQGLENQFYLQNFYIYLYSHKKTNTYFQQYKGEKRILNNP